MFIKMPRTGIPAQRFGARTRIGKVNDSIDQAPYVFQELGMIDRVATPDEIRRGIIGYRGRRTITLKSLREMNVDKFDKKIKELGKKKKDAPKTISKIYEEGQKALKDFQEKVRRARKVGDVIPFNRANEFVKNYVDFKANVIKKYEDRIEQVKQNIERSKNTQDRINDRRRRSSGERRIRYTYDRRIERERQRAYEQELSILEDFKNQNLKQIKFGEDIEYAPFKPVSEYASNVMDARYEERRRRLINRERRAIARERQTQAIKKEYPQMPEQKATEYARKLMRGEKVNIPLKYADQATIRKAVENNLRMTAPQISMFQWTSPKKYEEVVRRNVDNIMRG